MTTKTNYEKLYRNLLRDRKIITRDYVENIQARTKVEIPEDFNQNGWEQTNEAVANLIEAMEKLYEVKGKRMTPQFYKTLYNRVIVTTDEINKLVDKITPVIVDDYKEASRELMDEIENIESRLNMDKVWKEKHGDKTVEEVTGIREESTESYINRIINQSPYK